MQNQQLRLEFIGENKAHKPLQNDPPTPCLHAALEMPHQGTEPGLLLLWPCCILHCQVLLHSLCKLKAVYSVQKITKCTFIR